jgi:N-acetylmuramoyl-L-alanine amidase
MQPILFYLLKVILCSAVLYAYYLIALKDRKFHYYNRFYLLAIVLFSWIVPMFNITLTYDKSSSLNKPYQLFEVITDNNGSFEEKMLTVTPTFDWSIVFNLMMICVSLIVAVGLVRSLIRIYQLIRTNPSLKMEGLNLILTEAKGTPYSFFSYIFWNRAIDLESKIGKQMLAHEWVHARQKHSADKLFLESMMILGWFNPIFWILKKELYLIHEFIADDRSIENNDSAQLAELLLTAAYPQQQTMLTHSFFFSPIKRRIKMFKQNSSTQSSYFRRIIVLPIAASLFFLFAFRTHGVTIEHPAVNNQYTVVLDAGHGGHDPGATSSNGITESEMNLVLAKRIVALNKNSNIRFELSRDKDEFIKLTDRANYTVEKKADLFISIHMNASPSNQRSGLEIYCPQQGSAGFLRSLPLAGTMKLSLDGVFKSATIKTRKDKIWVLQQANVPAILILPGYITNPKDLSNIQARQEEIASKILQGIENYLAQKEKGYIKLPTASEWEQALPSRTSDSDTVIFTPPVINSDTVKFTPPVINSDTVIFTPPVIIKNKVEIVFDPSMTLAVLEKLRAGLKKEKIDLNFEKLGFNPVDGKLNFIKFHVDCQDGFKGSAEYPISNNKKVGFYRDYDSKAKSSFGIGILGE